MKRTTTTLGLILIASAIGNVVLWSRQASPAPASQATASGTVSTSMPTSISTAWPATTPQCRAELETVEAKLVGLESEIEARLTLDDKYERGIPTPRNEQRIRDVFTKVFADECPDEICVVHCRGAICKIEVDLSAKDTPPDFMSRFSQGSIGLFDSIRQGIRTERDAISGRRIHLGEITAEIAGEPEVIGRRLLLDIASAFLTSKTTNSCKQQHPERGHVVFHLAIEPGRAGIDVQHAGSLAAKPVAKCLRAVLDDVIQKRPVPPNAVTVPNFYFQVSVP